MHLQTKHLIIREFTPDDLDFLSSLLGDEKVMEFSVAGPISREQTKEFLEKRVLAHYARFGFGLYALVHTETNRLIGYAGLSVQSIDGEELVELGYRLDSNYWGKGLASEAAKALSQYAFDKIGLDQLISIIDPKNVRSIAVATRLGMHYWKDSVFHGHPVRIYSLKKVVVSPFDRSWAAVFEKEKGQLNRVFKNHDIEFFHIGSTSIAGCSAKPVIDILGVTSDVLKIDSVNQEMIELGFKPLGEYGMKQRRFFTRKTAPQVNLHIFEATDPEVGRHLRFCNYLRTHPDQVQEYSELKKTLAKQFPHDIARYIIGKEKFIKSIDLQAAWEASPDMSLENEKPKKKQWELDEILKAMEVNMHLQMTYFAKYVPTMEIVFEPDVTVVLSQIPDDTFNYVLSARFTEKNAKERIQHVRSLYDKTNLPFSWWVGESDTPSPLGDILVSQGFTFKEKNVGMYLDLDRFHRSQSPSALNFKRVESREQLKDFADVIVTVGEMPQIFDLLYSYLPPVIYCGRSPLEMYIGYLGNVPVVTGMLVTHANVAGIYYVMTMPQQRKKGFGSAMMEQLLQRAKAKGYFIATLQASHEGLSLYERLGFKSCCQFLEYAPSAL